MTQQKKQWSAIIIMIALFAMIAFVTNLCSPMAIIVKNDFGASNVLAQIGNYGNFTGERNKEYKVFLSNVFLSA